MKIVRLVLAVMCSCNTGNTDMPVSEAGLRQLKWLEGNWTMPSGDGRIMEQWQVADDTLMQGRSVLQKGDSTYILETIRLVSRAGENYYEPVAMGQNENKPVTFKLSSCTDTGFIAENPLHDFPKRISYSLINKDSIHAFVDGGLNKPGRRSDFYYSRQKE